MADPFAFAQREHDHPSRNWHNQCGIFTRTAFGAPSVGDFDGDGAADAEDLWKAAQHKHPETDPDKIPRGVPVFWSGGSADNGHAAVSRGNGTIWTTDLVRDGHVDIAPTADVARKWGLTLLGWTEDIGGVRVYTPPAPKPEPKPTPKPPRHQAFTLAVCNTMAGSNAPASRAASILHNTLTAFPHAVIVGVVEASNLLDANDAWKPTTDARDLVKIQSGPADKGNVALVCDRDRVEVLSYRYRIGARPFISGRRIKMRTRHMITARVRIDGRRRVRRVTVLHLPPARFAPLWGPMIARVTRVGAHLADFNATPGRVGKATGKRPLMRGVLGVLVPFWWSAGPPRSADVGGDHEAVAVTVNHRDRGGPKSNGARP